MASLTGSVECVNILIKHGADLSAKDVRSKRVYGDASQKRYFVICVIFVWYLRTFVWVLGTYAVGGKIYMGVCESYPLS